MQADQNPWSLRVEGNALCPGGLGFELRHVSMLLSSGVGGNAFVSMEGEAMLADLIQTRFTLEGAIWARRRKN